MEDIRNTDDVELLIHAFYTQAQKDELLAPIFEMRIKDGEWEAHMKRIIDFWNTVLFILIPILIKSVLMNGCT